MWQEYPFGPDEVACQKTSVSFVDSLWELLGAVLQGFPTVMVSDDDVRDLEALTKTLQRNRVTRIWLVPSLLRELLISVPDLGLRLPDLNFWVSSGEQLPRDLVELFESRLPDAELYNLYGTSEVWDATWCRVSGTAATGPVPIGRPIANTQAYVLDDLMEPVPVGSVGELYIGGLGLGRGYVRQPRATAAAFLPHPFSADAGQRLYRTGDLARQRRDGTILLMGRRDSRVKLRGHRIELDEIEGGLIRAGGVRGAVVRAPRRRGPGAASGCLRAVGAAGVHPGAGRRGTPAHRPSTDASRVHDPGDVRRVGRIPPHCERQDRPSGAACATSWEITAGHHLRGAADSGRSTACRAVGRHCSASSTWVSGTTSSSWAATHYSASGWWPGCGRGSGSSCRFGQSSRLPRSPPSHSGSSSFAYRTRPPPYR